MCPFLLLPALAPAHDDRSLGDPISLEYRADQKLRALILSLLQAYGHAHLGCHRSQPARRVGDADAGEQAHQHREDPDARLPDAVAALGLAEHARAEHEVRFAVDHWPEHTRDVGRIPLTVRV